jgi:hypothetical protein
MAGYESVRDHEHASGDDLSDLYLATTNWLAANRSVEIKPDLLLQYDITDMLPIVQSPPTLSYKIDGDVLRTILPDDAENIEVGESLQIAFLLKHYAPAVEDDVLPVLIQPSLIFMVKKADASNLLSEDYTVWHEPATVEQDARWKSSRLQEMREPKVRDISIEEPNVFDWDVAVNSLRLFEEIIMGTGRTRSELDLTGLEYSALASIIDHLDQINAILDTTQLHAAG